ncbi:MAG: hypothetical protein P4L62_00910 [Candidatus Pacebacteria bacterium]|nr:hypothetical protein [Candidatus Paceibacterota bacterium]
MKINKAKNQLITLAIIFFGLFGLARTSHAADFYIAQTAAGSGNGTSCANAKAYTWNWSGVQPGDTIWICGTINLVWGENVLVGASGSATTHTPVVLAFCDAGDCGGTYSPGVVQSVGQADDIMIGSGMHDIVIDGKNVGVVQATNNGSAIDGYANQGSPVGVYVYGSTDHITVQNLTIQKIYVHQYQTTTNDTAQNGMGLGIWFQGTTNANVNNCTISDAATGIVLGSGTSLVNVYDNTIKHCCMGISGGSGADDQTMDAIDVYDNDIEMGANWMSLDGNDCHANGIYLYSDGHPNLTSSTLTNAQFYNNYIHGPFAYWTNFPSGSVYGCTGFFHYDYGAGSGNIFFNNLVVAGPYINTSASPNPSNGAVSWADLETLPKMWNNTVIGPWPGSWCFAGGTEAGGVSQSSDPDIRNNVCVNVADGTYDGFYKSQADYNDENSFYAADIQGTGYSLANWKTALGDSCTGTPPNATPANRECNSIATAPALSLSYVPTGAPLVQAGGNLSSYCATYPALCYDKPLTVGAGSGATAGAARPSSGAWDIGAYQYQSGSGTTVPNGPTGLTVM